MAAPESAREILKDRRTSRQTRFVRPEDQSFLLVVTLFFGSLLVFGTFVNPLFDIIDEPFHADLVRFGGQISISTVLDQGWPGIGEKKLDPEIVRAHELQMPTGRRTASNALARKERLSFQDLADDPVKWDRSNRMLQHPPLYYLLVGEAVDAIDLLSPGPFAYDVELWVARLATLALLLPLPWVGYLTARRMSDRPSIWLGAAVTPALVPGLILRNGPMINNDTLLTALGTFFVYLLVVIAQDSRSPSTAVGVGVVVGLAMLTKGFGLILLVVLGFLHLWLLIRHRGDRTAQLGVLRSGGLAGTTALAIGGWWYVGNLLKTGTIQPAAMAAPLVPGFDPDWTAWIGETLSSSWASFWGGAFVFRDRYDALLMALTVLALLTVIVAIWRSRTSRRPHRVVAILPFLVLLTLIYARSAMNYAARAEFGGVHGRYLYSGLIGLTTLVAIGAGALVGRWDRWLPAGLGLGAGAVFLVSMNALLVNKWGAPASSTADRLRAVAAWAALPEFAVAAAGGLVLSSLALLLWRAVWFARNQSTNGEESGHRTTRTLSPTATSG